MCTHHSGVTKTGSIGVASEQICCHSPSHARRPPHNSLVRHCRTRSMQRRKKKKKKNISRKQTVNTSIGHTFLAHHTQIRSTQYTSVNKCQANLLVPGNEDLADFSFSYGPIMTSDEIWICRSLPEKKVSVMSGAVVRMHNKHTRRNLPNRRRENTLSSAAENEKKHPRHAIGCCARHRKYFPNSRLGRHDQRSLKDPSTAWRRTGFAVASCTSAFTLLGRVEQLQAPFNR